MEDEEIIFEPEIEPENSLSEKLGEVQSKNSLQNQYLNLHRNEMPKHFYGGLNNAKPNNAENSLATKLDNAGKNSKQQSSPASFVNNQSTNPNSKLSDQGRSLSKQNNGQRSRVKNLAQDAAAKYLKTKGVPEWLSKLAMNRNKSKSPIGMATGGLLGSKPVGENTFNKTGGTQTETNKLRSQEKKVNIGLSLEEIKSYTIGALCVLICLLPFICLYTAIKTYTNAKILHHSYSSEKLEQYMNDNMTDEEKAQKVEQEDVEKYVEEVGYNFIDYTTSKYVTIARKAEKFEQADLKELDDFYSYVKNYSEDIDEDLVYKFFFKLDFIKKYYKQNYEGVELDIPLLMATLLLQSDDMRIVFSTNTVGFSYKLCRTKKSDGYDYSGCWDSSVTGLIMRAKYDISYANLNFDYGHDWSAYINKTSPSNSQHDIEVLAQHMISHQATETCTDSTGKVTKTNILRDNEIDTQVLSCEEGESYSVTGASYGLDDEKYEEFLKEFIEKKYVLNNDEEAADDEPGNNEDPQSDTPGGAITPTGQKTPYKGSFFKQTDSRWAGLTMGSSGVSVQRAGCFMTSLTNQIIRSGTYIKPNCKPLDLKVTAKKFKFNSYGGLIWESSVNVAPNFVFKTRYSVASWSVSKIIDKINSYPDNYYIILGVSKQNQYDISHYVALNYVDKQAQKIYILDPSRNVSDLYSFYKLYRIYIWEKKD